MFQIAGPDVRRELPAGFWSRPEMVAALADYDFGLVFKTVQSHTGWTQQMLADLVGLDQSRISAIEKGKRDLPDVGLVAQVANSLWIPPALLGFHGHPVTVDKTGMNDQKQVSWVDRRDFVQTVAAAALGAAGWPRGTSTG